MAIAPSDNNNFTTTPGTSTSQNQQQHQPQQQQITSSENNNNNNNNKKLVNEMVGGCSVCSDDQGTEENPLVYCDGCEVAVHQACYGIVNVPSGSWFCRKCESGDGHLKIKCELCPSKEGALKRTETGDWAHVVCALYIPEVRFGNNNTMEPIEIKHIHAERYAKSCYLCEKAGNLTTVNYGAVMNCNKLGCKQSFHVTCAQTARLLCEEAGQGSDNVIYCGYCKHHFRKLKELAGVSRKTGNKSSSYNSASSYSDSASDSSQDNDTRCNTTTTDYDKINKKTSNNNNNNKQQNILPTNLSINDGLANDFHNTTATTTTTTTTISSQQNTANTSKVSSLTPNNGPISLTIPINNTSNKNVTSPSSSSTSSAKDATTKRKRAPKIYSNNSLHNSGGSIGVAATTNLPSSTLPTTGILSNPLGLQHTINPSQSSNINNHNNNNPNDMGHSQLPSDPKINEKLPITTPNKNNKSANKKNKTTTLTPPTSTTTISSSTQAKQQTPLLSTNTQPIPTTNYRDLNKISSPNLSLSTSPSLASPSSSAKSTSNSSNSSITTTASSCSSTSNSPSPALLSPNVTNNQRGANVRIESPLASKSKTGINSSSSNYKTLPESLTGNVASSTENPSILNNNPKGTRANVQQKNDIKKNSPSSSSLLSTALPMPHDLLASQSNPLPAIISGLVGENMLYPPGSSKDSSSMKNKQIPNPNTLPTVPPVIIPVPQTSTNNDPKSTAKTSKTGAKGVGTRKKSTETNENPKPEPKTKSSRTTKKNALAAAAAAGAATSTNSVPVSSSPSKSSTDTPKRGKGRTAASKQSNNLTSEQQTTNNTKRQSPSTSPAKRKSRSTSNESTLSAAPSPPKRQRKKKSDQQSGKPSQTNETLSSVNSIKQPPSLGPLNSQFLTNRPPSNSSGALLGLSGVGPGGPLVVNTPIPNSRLLGQSFNSIENHEVGSSSGAINNKYFSPMISPYTNYDNLSASSLSRASISRLFTASSADMNNTTNNNSQDDPAKAFEELRENTWSHLSRCVLEQAQQFDIPSLIGTLYTLRSENDKLVNRVRELTMKRDQLIAMNARLDLTGPMLTQHLNNTSPNFSSVVSGLTNSPKSLPASSPGSAIGSKQPAPPPPNPLASYNHVQSGNTLGPPGYLDSNSPMVSQTHSGINNIKTSSISTPSPPISALMAHSNSNRAGLITINPPYMPNVFPPMSTLAQLGTTPQSSSFYSRQ